MATAPSFDSDSDDELPAGWEERVTLDGKVYYASHENSKTQWTHPATGKKKYITGELPYGWERRVTEDGTVFYIDHVNEKTTFTDPRLAFAKEMKASATDIQQKFDGSSRALEVLQAHDLRKTYAIITGANSGIGYETARSLVLHGANVVLACRNMETAESCKKDLLKERPEANIDIIPLDLASLKSVKRFAEEYKCKERPLNLLILNAGISSVPYTLTEDGIESIFQTNHLGHHYLTTLLMDLLKQSKPARVVVVSSESHRFVWNFKKENLTLESLSPSSKNYQSMSAYNLSKLCNILFSNHLNILLKPHGITSNAVHPGNMINTNLSRNWWVLKVLFTVLRPFTKSLQQGAATTVYCAVASELEGIGGMYFNNCCRCRTSKAADDEQLAEALWDICERIIKERIDEMDT